METEEEIEKQKIVEAAKKTENLIIQLAEKRKQVYLENATAANSALADFVQDQLSIIID